MKATYIQPKTESMQLRAMSVMVGISGGGISGIATDDMIDVSGPK